MELQPPEAAVIYGADDRSHVDGFPQVREMLSQPAAHPLRPLVDVIHSTDFHYIVQNWIDTLPPCLARNQALLGYASKNFP